jgi:hypothetical protein
MTWRRRSASSGASTPGHHRCQPDVDLFRSQVVDQSGADGGDGAAGAGVTTVASRLRSYSAVVKAATAAPATWAPASVPGGCQNRTRTERHADAKEQEEVPRHPGGEAPQVVGDALQPSDQVADGPAGEAGQPPRPAPRMVGGCRKAERVSSRASPARRAPGDRRRRRRCPRRSRGSWCRRGG